MTRAGYLLTTTGAALLLLASPDDSEGRAALNSVPALLAGLPQGL